jgi:hypothetical protein
MVERFLEIFMDDFSVFGDSFDDCLTIKGDICQAFRHLGFQIKIMFLLSL